MPSKATQYSRQIGNVSAIYNIYRIVLALVLLISYISNPENTVLGVLDPTLFVQVTTAYAIFGVVVTFVTGTRRDLNHNSQFLAATLLIDIVAITLLTYSCGGIVSGLGLLLIVTIASGSIMIRGRISTFIAATATLSMLYSEIYLSLALEDPPNQFLQAGILGTILFATSLYIQTVTNRAYRAALLTDEQASNIVDLEKLNDEILQRMRTGIIVVNPENDVITMNSSARNMLSLILDTADEGNKRRYLLPDTLKEKLDNWRINPFGPNNLIEIPNSNTRLQTNFAFLSEDQNSDILVFVENHSHIMQRMQRTKLASLGRLTASIAHEVRNPLGAISHASQLLKESDSISNSDQRMVEIILNHCSRVNHIIEHVLDASRYKEDIAPKRIKLEKWLTNFIANYIETNKHCDEIKLEVAPKDSEVTVITSQLEQVVTNLFDNGLRYSKRATGKASLSVKAGQTSAQGVSQPYISVIDKGPGLKSEEESRLFEPFHTTEPTGTGLGLYISKELCEANQSSLAYTITDAGTSCFTIYFSNPDQSMI